MRLSKISQGKRKTGGEIMKSSLRVMGAIVAVSLVAATPVMAGNCDSLPKKNKLQSFLVDAPASGGDAGGLFHGTRMWGAIVDRDGTLCTFITTTDDPTQVWPGSQAIAKAKAYTANAFSLDILALSTARLYTLTQPGHSLFGLNNSNPFNPTFLAPPVPGNLNGTVVAGGMITFGGGVPLYNASGHIIGGLGVRGDTACTDHEVAKRVRDLAGLNPPGGPLADDIIFSPPPNVFAHPVCANTFRNGEFIGNERATPVAN